MVNYNGITTKMETKKVTFPIEYYYESLKTNGSVTVGELLHRDYGYDSNSWQHHFNDLTREELITQALKQIKTQFLMEKLISIFL